MRRTILQIIPDLDTGGAERTAVDVARALTAAGHRALVLSRGGRLVEELERAGAKHVLFPAAAKNPFTILVNAFRLARLIQRDAVDLVHARSRAPAWSALLACRITGTPFVTTYHGIYNQKTIIKALYNSIMARGDAIIANSHYTAKLIAERHPFARGRITVIHRGSDLAALAPEAVDEERRAALRQAWRLPPEEEVILNIARLTPWKGQRVLIDALEHLMRSRPAGWIAVLAGGDQGRDDYRRELEQRIERAGLKERVRLPGHCADVPAALSLSRVAVVASVEAEAFGRAAVEAQAAGVPVVVTDLGAAPETVLAPPEVAECERTGWRVPPGDPSKLAEAIATLLDLGEDARSTIAARARAHALQNFTREAMCAATLAVYDRVFGEPTALNPSDGG